MSIVTLMHTAGRGEFDLAHDSVAPHSIALRPVGGVPLVIHAIGNLLATKHVSHVVVVSSTSEVDAIRAVLPADSPVLMHAKGEGGLPALTGAFAAIREHVQDIRVILVHEVSRAFAPPDVIDRVAEAVLAGADSVRPVLPCSDTVKLLDADGLVIGTPARSGLRVAQTPQGFAASVFRRACDRGELAELLRGPALPVPGSPDARRIDSPFDLAVAEAALTESGDRS